MPTSAIKTQPRAESSQVVAHYTEDEMIDLTRNAVNSSTIRTLVKCESQNTNIARMDSNHLLSFGILQFNGTATWDQYASRAGVRSSTPMNPISAIKVADYMITVGQLHRWTCAKITHLL